MTINNCSFANNSSSSSTNKYDSHGGAIAITGGLVTINCCLFKNNPTNQHGGAITLSNCEATINESVFDSNSLSLPSKALGGAISLIDNSSATTTNSKFINNVVSSGQQVSGGAIYNTSDSALLNGVVIASSRTSYTYTSGCYKGGAAGIYNDGQRMVINNSILAGLHYDSNNNSCSDLHGAAVYNDSNGSISINYSLLYDNLTL